MNGILMEYENPPPKKTSILGMVYDGLPNVLAEIKW